MAGGKRTGRLQRQPVAGFGHLQPTPKEQTPEESAVAVTEAPADPVRIEPGGAVSTALGERSAVVAPDQPVEPTKAAPAPERPVVARVQTATQEPVQVPEPEVAEPTEAGQNSPANKTSAPTGRPDEARQVQAPEPRSATRVDHSSPLIDKPAESTQKAGKSQARAGREEQPGDGPITGTVAAPRRRTSPARTSSGYFQPRPAELPAPIRETLASLPRNYLSLYQSFSDAINPAVGNTGRNVRLNANLASRLTRQSVTDKRRLAAGTRRPALAVSHYIDAALRQARQEPLDVLVEMGQSFRIRTLHEDLPRPNTYSLTAEVGQWIDNLKDDLSMVDAYRGMLGHILNACVEAFLDGLEHETTNSA
ncbi:hypothetical protein HD597_000032 [Nonomuraea thailandensis]|uniref:Uncharacterized protein n=1 Tax=Nonomuraea thailandensis TaxID=1188745 RepID=A0A9X2G5K0_9ACTN|nr:hypothetical protein [Nonomuraea thailandensis]MCP2353012.1 hypothetical protein [Nonomuraea thailandensis]